MFSERQKRDASLGVLEKLRSKGMPSRPSEDVESMFEVAVNEGEDKEGKKKKKLPDIELEDDTAIPPQPVTASPDSKRRPPNLIPSGVDAMKSAFRKQR